VPETGGDLLRRGGGQTQAKLELQEVVDFLKSPGQCLLTPTYHSQLAVEYSTGQDSAIQHQYSSFVSRWWRLKSPGQCFLAQSFSGSRVASTGCRDSTVLFLCH